ncbi:hypothetical protein GP486_004960 [Trichoglossum hirsutum]|uniref:Glycine-rich domain-containing protein 1 n=1 Tax=Trichoglossum hirsutum TaxID=265104 RepID=A0A9P8LA40_9PEZI|nr:hypothetical protein GP486_004960 [Trichoglossum hirsutum]
MALAVGLDQRAVHQCSRAAIQSQVSSYGRPNPPWEPPKFGIAASKDEEPVIPRISIFAGLRDESKEPRENQDEGVQLPSVAECAVHLQLLESFHVLREKVLKSNALDRTFSIWPKIPRRSAAEYRRNPRRAAALDPTFQARRQKKWHIFVDLAVARFASWWGEMDNILRLLDAGEIPPLDVLMVWHSLLLNPRMYTALCEESGYQGMSSLRFPWKAVHDAISTKDSSFVLTESATATYSKQTGLGPDLLGYLANFEQFAPAVTKVLSKWANTELRKADIDQALQASPDMAPDQVCLLEHCVIAIDQQPGPTSGLRNAVLRQVNFVEKMGEQVWLRSPALSGTLNRAISRYGQFLVLFKKYPSTLLVPTLDIDLAWHTHLCSPQQYRLATSHTAGRFIDHDDTIDKDALEGGLDKTKDLFRIRFGEEYLRCLCWDCEALRSALEENPVRQGCREVDYEAISETVSLQVAYHRAVEIARRKQEPLPVHAV